MKRIAAGMVVALGVAPFVVAPAFAGGPVEPVAEPVIAPVATPVYVDPSVDWTGAYAGVQLGYTDLEADVSKPDGVIGGVHAGYRWDFGQNVLGAELAYNGSNADDDNGELKSNTQAKLSLGREFGRTLVYGTVGASYADTEIAGESLSDTGYLYGLGIDYAVNDRWVVGGEVLRHEFDDFDGSGVDVDNTSVVAKVSYRF